MKRFVTIIVLISLAAFSFIGCNGDDSSSGEESTYDPSLTGNTTYKQHMRSFVQGISTWAKGINSDFIVIPQNGHELLTTDGSPTGAPAAAYIAAISGVGREDLFYGYNTDDQATPAATRDKIIQYMDIAEANSVEVLTTDYCWTTAYVDDSYEQNNAKGYISFAANSRELDRIPTYPSSPYNVNTENVATLADAKNYLYLLNPDVIYGDKTLYLNALKATNYDVIIIDLYFAGDEILTAAEVASLKTKPGGGSRLVIAYMSIGEAEDYRYYWNTNWETNPPSWLLEENPDWPGNYKVEYWNSEWQAIMYGNDTSYLQKIINAGFDGVYLDLIDAFEYFEENY